MILLSVEELHYRCNFTPSGYDVFLCSLTSTLQ